MTRTIVVRTASLPLIPPSHPLLMFSTDSEPCRMCTETSTRSTPLLPGRGSDYIWSINTHRLWEALCLSLLLPSLSSPPFSPHSCSLYDSVTFGHNLSGNLPLLPYFPYIKSGGGVSLRRRPLSDPPRIGSFIHELFPCSGVVPSFQRPCPLPPLMKKACKLRRAGCRCAQWSILIAQESIGIWVRLVPLKGWPEDLALSVLSVTEISTQACIRLMWQSPYCLHANAHAV